MSDTVIRVENLSKKYILGHQKQEGHTTLRDSITNGARGLLKPFQRNKSPLPDPSSEEFWALNDVSFNIKQGDRVGIIGRNGAGKSTLLKILSRITEPTNGSIRIQGRVASLLEVGTGFHPELTGRENISLNGAILGMSKIEIARKFDEIVEFAEVERFLDTPVKRYSSGMYVRLAFSVAAHLEPEVLIVDEVLAVGDIQFQKKCLGKMGEVASEGRTVIFVSHNMSAISSLCDKAIYLKSGKVESIGRAEDVVGTYFSEVLQNKVKDLDQLRESGFGDKVRFSEIDLISQGKVLNFGEPIQYKLKILSHQNLDKLSIGSSIYNNSGVCIGSLLSPEFSTKDGQQLEFKLTISNGNLAPGSYYAGFSVGFGQEEGTRKELDVVIGKPAFEVVSACSIDSFVDNWHPNWGSIVFTGIDLQVENSNSIQV